MTLSLIDQRFAVIVGAASLLLGQQVRAAFNPGDAAGEVLATLPDPFAGLGEGATSFEVVGAVPPQIELRGRTIVRTDSSAPVGQPIRVGVALRSGTRGLFVTLTFMVLGGQVDLPGMPTQPTPAPSPAPTPTPPPSPSVSFSLAAFAAPEGDSGTKTFTLNMTRSTTAGALSVTAIFSPGATSPNDFANGAYPGDLVFAFAPGANTASMTVLVQSDTSEEPDETFSYAIQLPAGYVAGANMSVGVTIGNDDVAPTDPGSLQRLSLATAPHYGQAGTWNIVGGTPGSAIVIVKDSLTAVPSAFGVTVSNVDRTLSGTPTARSILLRETTPAGAVRHTLLGIPNLAAPTMPIGMNLTELNYYSQNDLTIDYLKCGGWADNNATLNANGLPIALPNGVAADYLWPIEDGLVAGVQYRVITDGDMDMDVYSILSGNQLPGDRAMPRTALTKSGSDYLFTYTGAPVPRVNAYLSFRTIRSAPTRIALVREDEKALHAAGELFRPRAVADLKRFACLRDLNMVHPIGAIYHDTKPATYISWYVTPLAVLAKLAIKTGVPLWHQFNYLVTDQEFAGDLPILVDLQSRGLLKCVEVGNEIWNEATFSEEYNYAKTQAQNNPACTAVVTNPYHHATWWGGYRSAQLSKIASDAGTPIKFAVGPQPVQPNLWGVVKAGLDAVAGRPALSNFVYMSTAYCSGIINLGVTGAMGAMLDAAVAANDVDILLDNALNFPADAPDWGQYTASIVHMQTLLAKAKTNATANGMELVCYEGHGHFNAQPYARNIQTYKLAFVEMYKSAVMKIAARQILETAQAAGVTLMNWFEWNGRPTQFESGYFGTADFPAYDVLVDWQASLSNATPPPDESQGGFRYLRLTPTENVNRNTPDQGNYRTGSREIDLLNGSTVLSRAGWVATDVQGATTDGNIPQNVLDGDNGSAWLTSDGSGKAGVIIIDTGAATTIATDLRLGTVHPDYVFFSVASGTIETSVDGIIWTLRASFGPFNTAAYAGGYVTVPLT